MTAITLKNEQIPSVFELNQNYPNPFNPSTTLRFGLPYESFVTLRIYNVLGQEIEQLVESEQSAGWHDVTWTANASTGIYFYRIEAVELHNPSNRFLQVKKMLLMK